ncbi:MAG: hypothetical protein QM680_06720 [Luteolibacter sp.]
MNENEHGWKKGFYEFRRSLGRVLEIETPADRSETGTSLEANSNSGNDIRQAGKEAIRNHLKVNKALAKEDRFALAPAHVASTLQDDIISRIRNPEARSQNSRSGRPPSKSARKAARPLPGEWLERFQIASQCQVRVPFPNIPSSICVHFRSSAVQISSSVFSDGELRISDSHSSR